MSLAARTGAVIVTALVVACSSNDSDHGTPLTATSAVVTTYAQAFCDHMNTCDASGLVLEYGDIATCVDVEKRGVAFGLQLPGVSVTEGELGACASAIGSLDCNATEDALPACDFAGTRATGAPCESSTQCASAYCVFPSTNGVTPAAPLCGTCGVVQDVGGPCDGGDGCKPGLDCDLSAGPGRCSPKLAKGAACLVQGPSCVSGLRCINAVCSDPIPAGGTCDAQSDQCAVGFDCEDGKCVAFQETDVAVDIGQPCGTTTTNTVCKGGLCVSLVCVAFAKEGEPCSVSSPGTSDTGESSAPECAQLLHCEGGKCMKNDPLECK